MLEHKAKLVGVLLLGHNLVLLWHVTDLALDGLVVFLQLGLSGLSQLGKLFRNHAELLILVLDFEFFFQIVQCGQS